MELAQSPSVRVCFLQLLWFSPQFMFISIGDSQYFIVLLIVTNCYWMAIKFLEEGIGVDVKKKNRKGRETGDKNGDREIVVNEKA